MACPKCGKAYFAGDPDEEAIHFRFCDMMIHGPAVSLRSVEDVLWCEEDQRIIRVTDSSPEDQRVLAQNTSRVANREMRYDFGIYRSCDPPDERQIRLYLYVMAGRSVGLLLVERRTTIWLCQWQPDRNETPVCTERPDLEWMWSVGFVWTHRDLRRSGAAERLLSVALSDLKLQINKLGWYTPFSEAGEEFVRRVCPVEFHVAK